MPTPNDTLPDDPATLKAMLLAERLRNERLVQMISELQRHRFGRRAETLPEDQLLLGLEDFVRVRRLCSSSKTWSKSKRAAKRRWKRRLQPSARRARKSVG